MNPTLKGVIVAALQVALIATLGAKLLIDRNRYPRVWAQALPVDPTLPIRGRYVQIRVAAQPRGLTSELQAMTDLRAHSAEWIAVTLRVEGDQLVAEQVEKKRISRDSTLQYAAAGMIGDQPRLQLMEPLAYFIPEGVADPSRRAPGEALWVEVTIPPAGPPRPIRLGVRKGDGPIEPLALD